MAKFQLGPLRLTTVATQKKGQVKEISVSGGGEAKPIEIRPASYSMNHFLSTHHTLVNMKICISIIVQQPPC